MMHEHAGKRPAIDVTAWVAPDATVCGDVAVGPGARVMPGVRLVAAAGGRIEIGPEVIVMENAVIRATGRHACRVGANSLVGPQAHVVGATLEGENFVATGAAVFHGASLGRGVEVRINAVVHIRTRLAPGATVPIGWVAVGDPARLFPPDRHDEIWALQAPLDFPGWVYGVDRTRPDAMVEITRGLSRALAAHADDVVI